MAFPGYAPGVTLKRPLKRDHSDLSPARDPAMPWTLQSADVILPATDGRELRLRPITTPSTEQQQPLDQLLSTLPDNFYLNFRCSVNSSAA